MVLISGDFADNESSIVCAAIKLELGSKQTLAHKDADDNWVLNDPVDYEAEYAKCAQYDLKTGRWIGYAQPVNDAIEAAITGAIEGAY